MKTEIALPLQQHPHFATALRRLRRSVRIIDVAGAAPVVAVRQFGQLMTSRGPIWHHQTDQDAALARSGLRVINADRPNDRHLHSAGFRRLMSNASVAELDLTGTNSDRERAMKAKWRSSWRSAQKTALTFTNETFDPDAHAWLLRADIAQQRAKRFRSLPHALLRVYAACYPTSTCVFTATEGGMPIAAMLFLWHGPVATYYIGWTTPRGRSLCAHHRIMMRAADRFADRGCVRLDLGGVDTDNAPGLARFKIGTGATVRPLGGTWLRIAGRWA